MHHSLTRDGGKNMTIHVSSFIDVTIWPQSTYMGAERFQLAFMYRCTTHATYCGCASVWGSVPAGQGNPGKSVWFIWCTWLDFFIWTMAFLWGQAKNLAMMCRTNRVLMWHSKDDLCVACLFPERCFWEVIWMSESSGCLHVEGPGFEVTRAIGEKWRE